MRIAMVVEHKGGQGFARSRRRRIRDATTPAIDQNDGNPASIAAGG